jgi:hypothetical protein
MFRTRKLWTLPFTLLSTVAAGAELPSAMGWSALPNTQLRPVCAAEHGFPQANGASGCEGITSAWSSGVMDTKRNRLIIFGGGHNDYYGNELYAANLDTQTLTRITDPGLPTADGSTCSEGIANNTQPNSRHTYDGIEYIERADKMFVFGGSLACAAGNFGKDTWTFDFTTSRWQKMNPTGPIPWGDAGVMTAYDPQSGLIYLHDRLNLYTYDVAADKYTKVSASQVAMGYHMGATIDTKRRKFVIVGYDAGAGGGRVYTYDLGASSSRVTVNSTGGTAIVNNNYPGLDYDPVSDRIVGWTQSSPGSVFSLNLDTGQWATQAYSGNPSGLANGTNGHWRYSPKSQVFVVANDIDSNIMIMRTSPPAKVPMAPSTLSAR